MDHKFRLYFGDLIGLPTNENHLNFRWIDKSLKPGMVVLFSCAKMGKAMSCHYANRGASYQQVKKAMKDFEKFIFSGWPECEMILAKVKNKRVADRLVKFGFELFGTLNDAMFYCKPRGK